MGDVIKNQHYVPQSYLRRFAKDDRVWVYDKFKGASHRTFRTAVRNVASESYFYDIPAQAIPAGIEVDQQFLEKTFAKMEEAFKIEVDKLITRIENYRQIDRLVDYLLNILILQLLLVHFKPTVIRHGRLIEGQRQALAFYMAQQILRTKEYRNLTNELYEKMTQAVADTFLESRGKSGDSVKLRDTEEQQTLRHIQLLIDPSTALPIYECLAKDIWSIGVNLSAQPLYTSDNPVVKKAHLDESLQSYSGWCSPGIEILYPLTSRYILILWDRKVFNRLQYRDGRLFALTSENITYLNSLQVMQSYRQVYCLTNSFDIADQVCVAHPDVCRPERSRVQVHGG